MKSEIPSPPFLQRCGITPRHAALGVVVIVAVCLTPLPFILNGESGGRLSDAGHIPLCFLVMLGLELLLGKSRFDALRNEAPRRILLAAALLLTGSIVVELIQPYFGREKSLTDFFNGAEGTLIGALFLALAARRRSLPLWFAWFLGSAAVCAAALVPAWNAYQLELFQRSIAPELTDFTHPESARLFYPIANGGKQEVISIVDVPGATPHPELSIRTVPDVFSGVVYTANSSSWRGADALRLEFRSPAAEPLDLFLRVDDHQDCSEFENRYNGRFQLLPGETVVEIPIADIERGPKSRPLDLDRIDRLLIFVAPQPKAHTFTLRRIALTTLAFSSRQSGQ